MFRHIRGRMRRKQEVFVVNKVILNEAVRQLFEAAGERTKEACRKLFALGKSPLETVFLVIANDEASNAMARDVLDQPAIERDERPMVIVIDRQDFMRRIAPELRKLQITESELFGAPSEGRIPLVVVIDGLLTFARFDLPMPKPIGNA